VLHPSIVAQGRPFLPLQEKAVYKKARNIPDCEHISSYIQLLIKYKKWATGDDGEVDMRPDNPELNSPADMQ
jgi:hypothetical protein